MDAFSSGSESDAIAHSRSRPSEKEWTGMKPEVQ